MYKKNEFGTWIVYDGVEILVEPSQEWKNINQGGWLICPETAKVNDVIEIKADCLNSDTFTFIIWESEIIEEVQDGQAAMTITIDSTAQIGDELDIMAIHPIYGKVERVVTIVG